MIEVVGGTYEEYCQFPIWRQIFGSGGRAAAAIATLGGSVRLHTFGAPGSCGKRRALADAYGFALGDIAEAPDLAFDYFHALSPIHVPAFSRRSDSQARRIPVQAEQVLRFGMLEGEGVVHAKRAVYDPQSPKSPSAFEANGSSAQELAIVCNLGEAQLLTQATTAQDCAAALTQAGAAVAVIKAGPAGAVVSAGGRQHRIPCYRTNRVFALGSGDVFSGVFAKAWLQDGLQPAQAADRASRATALYCASMTLPTASALQEAGTQLQPLVYGKARQISAKSLSGGAVFLDA